MKKLFLTVLAVIGCLNVNAQNLATSGHALSIDLLGVEYGYEKAIGNNFTITGRAGITSGFSFESNETFGGHDFIFRAVIVPEVGIDAKYYYNLIKRDSKGKVTTRNSGNFVALDINYFINAPLVLHNYDYYRGNIAVSPNWGFRRVYKDKIFIETKLGVNVHFMASDIHNPNEDNVKLSPNVQFKFGILL